MAIHSRKYIGGVSEDQRGKMKVIFITREGYQLSGSRVRCYGFARQLNKYGIETQVFSFADNLGAEYAERESQMGWARKLKYNLAAFRRLIQEDKKSIFFLQRLNYHALAPLLVNLLRRNKLVFDCDDWNIREDPRYYFGIFPSSKMEYATRRLAKRADLCIAASHFLKEYLGRFNKRVHYLPTGVDTDLFFPQVKEDTGRVVFSWIGTAYHPPMRDNLMFILSCFSQLAAKYNNIFLYLAGEGKYYDEFAAQAEKSSFSERIKISGWICPEQIPGYLWQTDIGLLPLTQESYFNRAKSPTKLFEYMAMEKPAICSTTGEAKNIIVDGETGLLAESRDEFISKMELLIVDRQLRKSIAKNARQKIEADYSLKVLGEELAQVLRGLDG